MLNYRVSPDLLGPLLPRGTALDLWDGTAYVSAVGFLFERIRVLGIPLVTHRSFEEVNLRFYVSREVDGEIRHGVTFIRELVPRRLIATAAKLTYNEPYRRATMFHRLDVADSAASRRAAYEWRIGPRFSTLWVDAEGAGRPLVAGSFEDFRPSRMGLYAPAPRLDRRVPRRSPALDVLARGGRPMRWAGPGRDVRRPVRRRVTRWASLRLAVRRVAGEPS